MNDDLFKPAGKLRYGWTTGACATAATKAALLALLQGHFENDVTISLPGGQEPIFILSRHSLEAGQASAGIIKDAGDDPDVTHGAEIIVTVRQGHVGSGITFVAGPGVGTVTLPGLPVPVGEPAINPAPRKMMTEVAKAVAASFGKPPDFEISIAIPGGEKLAEKTMNGRLGIIGGLSILGTTGIVRPYSCSAWIHSIHSGIDVARATGITHIAATTGSTSETAIKALYGLTGSALIDMGDFAGGLLKYLRHHRVEKLTLAGGFGKLTKLAQGNMDLHSDRSQLDFNKLAACLKDLGGGEKCVADAKKATTAMAVLDLARTQGLPLADLIARRAHDVALSAVDGGLSVEVCVFDRGGQLVGRAEGDADG
ncbi:MAG: cobalt-precorrin-5B (C(1))-methyltransferase [Rhodospirillaceae bacterium]|nr:cobalt-precorrin-5B (C(1))-methyltransferase [Rhodospirillaceae bacterium]MBL6930780.1 cobalt-precorrin-5B (C(1))-methyltransferase [Rhodospirillales bacterium]MBL6942392.1 cobalt-precorrin-5B (C(1))-methyltransferase [Rhodospirillales bacterium]